MCVYDVAMMTECDCVLVEIPLGRSPPHTEEISPTIVTDRDSTHRCRHCQSHTDSLAKWWGYYTVYTQSISMQDVTCASLRHSLFGGHTVLHTDHHHLVVGTTPQHMEAM